MKQEQTLKMTDLDYMTASPHLQMIKAALPYINVQEQRFFSMLVKVSELERTMKLFTDKEEGALGICSLEKDEPSSPFDMLNAMKPFGSQDEQDFIDLIINFLQGSRLYHSYRDFTGTNSSFEDPPSHPDSGSPPPGGSDSNSEGSSPWPFSMEQLKNMLPEEQQSRLETAQLLMQTFRQFS